MSLKLTKEGAYGYISVLISKSPNLALLLDIIESSEPIDVQTAISRGILGSEYSLLIQAKSIDSIDEIVYNSYKHLIEDLLKFMPKPYNYFVDHFVEIFDLDKVISMIFMMEKQKLKVKYIVSQIGPLMEYIVYSKRASGALSSYTNCLSISKERPILDVIKCLMKVYVDRVVNTLYLVSELEPIENSLKIFYLFSLLRFYRYVLNYKMLRITYNIELKDFAKEIGVPISIISLAIEKTDKIYEYIKKDRSYALIYELKSIYEQLKLLLYSPYSFIDRLTYLLIHKFYESMLIRYLTMHRYAWR
ncbi:MAG: hypothetical protein QW775_01510 [Ignisphaera sp.]|uniref:Uncharacterized protein n=1 Tax=Ignisphaera aggregans TaxID=334771 RepID=A0A7C4NQN1_9CREN